MKAHFTGLVSSAVIHLAGVLLLVVPLFGGRAAPEVISDSSPAQALPLNMMISSFKEPAPGQEVAVEPESVIKTNPVEVRTIKKSLKTKRVIRQKTRAKATSPQKKATRSHELQSQITNSKESTQEKHIGEKPVASGDSAMISIVWQRYRETVRLAVQQQRRYPLQSRRRHEQGTVVVEFRVDRGGNVSRIRVKVSSGHLRLDTAAITAIQSTGRFQPFPSIIGEMYREFELPVRFNL